MKQSEFKKRRKQLMQSVGKGNIALIGSASMHTRNRDVDFPFRQDSDFYYLTGYNEFVTSINGKCFIFSNCSAGLEPS